MASAVRESSFCDKDQNNAIVRALYEFKQKSIFCDVIMKVCGREIYAHANILAAASPYFQTFLSQELPRQFSQKVPQVIEIQIDGAEASELYEEAVSSVIDFIYTGKMAVTEANHSKILEIARIMQMESIVKYCEAFGQGKIVDESHGECSDSPHVKQTSNAMLLDAETNTDVIFGVGPVTLSDVYRPGGFGLHSLKSRMKTVDSAFAAKVKSKQLISVALQVYPHMLSQPNRSDNLNLRDQATSTDQRDFEYLRTLTYSRQHAKKRKARRSIPKKHVNKNDDYEFDANKDMGEVMSDSGDSATERCVPEDDTPLIQEETDKLSAPESESNKEILEKLSLTVKEEMEPSAIIGTIVTEDNERVSTKDNEHDEAMSPCPNKHDAQTDSTVTASGRMVTRSRGQRADKTSWLKRKYADSALMTPNRKTSKRKQKELTDEEPGKEPISEPVVQTSSEITVPETESDIPVEEQGAKNDGSVMLDAVDMNMINSVEVSEEHEVPASSQADEHSGSPEEDAAKQLISLTMAARTELSTQPEQSLPTVPEKEPDETTGAENEKHDNTHEKPQEVQRPERMEFFKAKLQKARAKPLPKVQKKVKPQGKLFKSNVGPGKYQCDICSFHTNKVREMSAHVKIHKIENNTCYYCEQVFEVKDELLQHMAKHKGPEPFYCHKCGIRFKSRTLLNMHIPKHSDLKPFICDVCGMAFKWKHALKCHMLTHGNKKEHLCDICGYATNHKSQLKAHWKLHTGDTFKCQEPGCTFEATKIQNMKYHMLTHTREKPHQCDVCGQNFSLVKNLRRHMLLHKTDVDKRFKCSHCTFKSVRPDKVKEHILKIHGVGTPPERRLRITEQVQLHRGIMPSSHIKTKMKPGRKEGQAKGDLQLAEGVNLLKAAAMTIEATASELETEGDGNQLVYLQGDSKQELQQRLQEDYLQTNAPERTLIEVVESGAAQTLQLLEGQSLLLPSGETRPLVSTGQPTLMAAGYDYEVVMQIPSAAPPGPTNESVTVIMPEQVLGGESMATQEVETSETPTLVPVSAREAASVIDGIQQGVLAEQTEDGVRYVVSVSEVSNLLPNVYTSQ